MFFLCLNIFSNYNQLHTLFRIIFRIESFIVVFKFEKTITTLKSLFK